jgi:hypothetical protein
MQRTQLVWIGISVAAPAALGQDWKNKPAADETKRNASEILSDSLRVIQVMAENARISARRRRGAGKESLRSTSAEVIPRDDSLVALFRLPQTGPIALDDEAVKSAARSRP